MNSRLQLSKYWLVMILLITANLHADNLADPTETLDSYFKHLQKRFKQLADENITAAEQLAIRSDLVNGRHYWLPVKGKPGRAFNVISFFQRKHPSSWTINGVEQELDKASAKVDFDVAGFAGYPWQTRFELIRDHDRWLITSFTDLTRRPIPPGASITSVIEHYLGAARDATAAIYSGMLSREEKQKLTTEYGFGAGYWVGQTSRKDLPAGSLFSYLLSRRTFSWEIEPARMAGDYGEAVVHIHSKPKYAEPLKKTYTLELSRLNQEWFLANHRSKKSSTTTPEKISKANPNGHSADDLVLQQLELLRHTRAKLSDLAEASQPLWISTRTARQGMGRLFGMALGSNSSGKNQLPEWEIVSDKDHGDSRQIMVQAIWPEEQAVRLFNRIQFSVVTTQDGWRLSDAQLLRN